MTAAARNGRPARLSARLRPALTLLAFGGAIVLTVLPLVRPAEPFDAALRCTVWCAVVIAASAGARKPAALFATVAALVEICGHLTAHGGGPGSSTPVPAVLVAMALIATRKGPRVRRVITRLIRSAGRRGAARPPGPASVPTQRAPERAEPETVRIG
ncbi:hypothetical protein AB0M36_29795 [Actinoplanes sp. NPDC051346]|uniref:hypothetical protein n=1 Tax=Actinoplanes sp. NPDC051346 TaxID=3155048 RepID=UPI0034213391